MVDYSLAGLYLGTRRDSQSLATLSIRLLNNFVMHSKLSNENSDAARMPPHRGSEVQTTNTAWIGANVLSKISTGHVVDDSSESNFDMKTQIAATVWTIIYKQHQQFEIWTRHSKAST